MITGIFRLLPVLPILWWLSGCAVMDTNLPAWSAYQAPETGSDLQLAYRSHGQGQTVLLIHGFGASSYSWRYLIPLLSESYRVITIDLKGFGASPKPQDRQYSVYDQARLVRDFILQQDLDQLILVGHSFGGGVALTTAIYLQQSHPQLIDKLVLMDSIAYQQELPDFVRIIATPLVGSLIVSLVPNEIQIRRLLEEVYYDDALIPPEAVRYYAEQLGQKNAKYATVTGATQMIPGDLDELSSRYQTLDIPTLLIWGRNDEIVPVLIGQRLQQVLPDSELIILEGVGHAPQEERPELTLPMLMEFFQAP